MTRTAQRTRQIVGVDLFCGVGGLTYGLSRSGVRIVAGIDLDESCRYAYEANNQAEFICANVSDITPEQLSVLLGDGDRRLLAGCAPCQPFSTYSRKHRKTREDEKWELVAEFGRLIKELQPEFITMENVPQLADHPVFEAFLKCVTGYEVWWSVIDGVEVGIPQSRKRLVLVGSRLGVINMDDAFKSAGVRRTVRDAIAQLPPLAAGGKDARDPMHVASRLSDLNLKRIRASAPGGTWRDWDESLRAACHLKESGETYPSVYGRMEWDAPAPTMTTQFFGFGNGRFGHPEQDRAISLREGAILQTFPRNYKFVEPGQPVRFNRMGKLIGNAVPVRLGELIGSALVAHCAECDRALMRKKEPRRAAKSG